MAPITDHRAFSAARRLTAIRARQRQGLVIYFDAPANPEGERSMQDAHISALSAKHAVLDQRIIAESQRPQPDQILIHDLKKQKLRLKEALSH
jgi:hypothetical protein